MNPSAPTTHARPPAWIIRIASLERKTPRRRRNPLLALRAALEARSRAVRVSATGDHHGARSITRPWTRRGDSKTFLSGGSEAVRGPGEALFSARNRTRRRD